MANLLYPKFKEALLSGAINLTSDTIKVALLTSGYTYSSSHQYYSDLGANVVGTPQTLASKTVTNGVFDANDITYTALTGSTVTQFAIYKDTGTAGTSPLMALFDTATGLPFTPTGADESIVWDNGSNGIFKL